MKQEKNRKQKERQDEGHMQKLEDRRQEEKHFQIRRGARWERVAAKSHEGEGYVCDTCVRERTKTPERSMQRFGNQAWPSPSKKKTIWQC